MFLSLIANTNTAVVPTVGIGTWRAALGNRLMASTAEATCWRCLGVYVAARDFMKPGPLVLEPGWSQASTKVMFSRT